MECHKHEILMHQLHDILYDHMTIDNDFSMDKIYQKYDRWKMNKIFYHEKLWYKEQ
jgi:hypothetical protein